MFDIKDYAADHNKQLKTFVVQVGLRKTIFTILIPLTLIGLASFIVFAIATHFPLQRILINIIPFIALIVVAYSLHERKKILYYLAVIDGLMLVKAACGIAGVLLVP
jgi:4-hydroxybenzoate polyprenyltransferase